MMENKQFDFATEQVLQPEAVAFFYCGRPRKFRNVVNHMYDKKEHGRHAHACQRLYYVPHQRYRNGFRSDRLHILRKQRHFH